MKIYVGMATAIVLLLAAFGCERTTVEGTSGKKLTLVRPSSQSLRRGETNRITITITRTDFTGAVKVDFDDLPMGVTVVEDKPILARDNFGIYTLHAGPEAGLVTRHLVKVSAEGPEGMTATEEFEISVADRTN